ncbi:hypothetical protein JGG76_24495 [Salmonella enterica subsp. enterica serovar Derby]|nr:hypothetical protein [Salmonella enterica subsp. enterica serovar Derby]
MQKIIPNNEKYAAFDICQNTYKKEFGRSFKIQQTIYEENICRLRRKGRNAFHKNRTSLNKIMEILKGKTEYIDIAVYQKRNVQNVIYDRGKEIRKVRRFFKTIGISQQETQNNQFEFLI